jgi:DNA-binding NarL/FixJ family response regulator
MDLSLPDGEGIELIKDLREANPHFAALVLTASLDRAEHARAASRVPPASCTSPPAWTR